MASVTQPEDLKQIFKQHIGSIIDPSNAHYQDLLKFWGHTFKSQSEKGLIPLFITGSGTSIDEKVPSIWNIVDRLKEEFKNRSDKNFPDVVSLFKKYDEIKEGEKADRTIVASILNSFQEHHKLKANEWTSMNKWLLNKILKAKPSEFHENLAKLYYLFNAVCLTLNFDGLLIRYFINNKIKAFSLPKEDECEAFFLHNGVSQSQDEKAMIEIQIRGDILYIQCQSKQFCPNALKKHSLWKNVVSEDDIDYDKMLRCPYCGEPGISYLSFPGSFEKERDMQKILSVIWKYLALRVGSVTVVGFSGEWDPLVIAFLGDLLSERDIPILVIDKKATDKNYIYKELISSKLHTGIILKDSANEFMKNFDKVISSINSPNKNSGLTAKRDPFDDEFWYGEIKKEQDLKEHINFKQTDFEATLKDVLKNKERLDKFAQLGMKSYWLGKQSENHNRYYHSIGVMKISSFLYDHLKTNSGQTIIESEKQFLRIAALLHDIGHLPFSHLIEDVFNELSWRYGSYQTAYSHTFYTSNKINQLFNKPELKKYLTELGYQPLDVINLINGCFGVGYLDAIINSPIDADKIDYIFRDEKFTASKLPLSKFSFLRDIVSGIRATNNGLMILSGDSAKAARDLIETRLFVFKNLYIKPGILVLEGIVKEIIKTYFVHELRITGPSKVLDKINNNDSALTNLSDLGHYKVLYCIDILLKIVKEAKNASGKSNIELFIIKSMFKKLEEKKVLFDERFIKNLRSGFELICKTEGEDKIKGIEREITYKKFAGNKQAIKNIIKDVKMRIPGAAIIEICAPPSVLSIPEKRKEKERSDGTKQYAECILVPEGDYELWDSTCKAGIPITDSAFKNLNSDSFSVVFYPLSEDMNNIRFNQSLNLFNRLIGKKGIAETKTGTE